MSTGSGKIYVVATPIGNLGDMTTRAIEVLNSVDLILAEDTRHSMPLLRHFQIQTQCQAFHEHNEKSIAESVCERVRQGESVAIISDAGVPLISDPGFPLVRMAHEYKLPVVTIPGACAAISAISVAGLATDRFSFEGFLPSKAGAKRKVLEALLDEPRTMIFYESPRRVIETLRIMVELFGEDRQAVLARELTKLFETVHKAPLRELLEFVESDSNQVKGEIVLLLEGIQKEATDEDEAELKRILSILLEEVSVKQAVSIAMKLKGLKRNQVYPLALKLKEE
ncbi:MAG: 16S rRNA (cytidine(1402)-2'-O)-methyltransferase [Gammaproteobacteria bacterium]|nr:16S rRNA (cytidine(1402)-2'-O)-methyltransferase [Gammaproteobacteria bacterium]